METRVELPSAALNRVEILQAVAKRVKAGIKSVQSWDPNVCDFSTRDSIVHVARSGSPLSHELRFKHNGRHVTISANSDWLCLKIRKNKSDPELPVFCSINHANKIDFRREIGLPVGIGWRYAVFLPTSEKPSDALLYQLSAPGVVESVNELIRDDSESLHILGDRIDLYSKASSEEEVLLAVEYLSTLVDEVSATGSPGVQRLTSLDALPKSLRDLVPLIDRWADTDDADRDALLDDASDAELQELVRTVQPRFEQINKYLDSFQGAPPESAAALGTLAQCAVEAQLKLSHRITSE